MRRGTVLDKDAIEVAVRQELRMVGGRRVKRIPRCCRGLRPTYGAASADAVAAGPGNTPNMALLARVQPEGQSSAVGWRR